MVVTMSRSISNIVVGLLTLVLSSACSTVPPIDQDLVVTPLPSELGKDGIVMATFVFPTVYSKLRNGYAEISRGKRQITNGQLVAALRPGKYKLRSLHAEWAERATYETMRHHTERLKFDQDREFTVETGKVTNLGLVIVLASTQPNMLKRATMALADNNVEQENYLRANYPDSINQLRSPTPLLAPGKYVDQAELRKIRGLIAESVPPPHPVVGEFRVEIGGAGTANIWSREEGTRNLKNELLETGTLAEIVDVINDNGDLLILSADGWILRYRDGRIQKSRLPLPVHAIKFAVLGSGGLVAVDNRMRIFASANRGQSWSTYTGLRLSEPTKKIQFVHGSMGSYIYTKPGNTIESIVYVANNAQEFRALPVPQTLFDRPQYGAKLREVTGGLWIDYHGKEFQYLATGQTVWQSRSKPRENCMLNDTGLSASTLIADCAAERYQSRDGGKNWMKIAHDGITKGTK